VYLIKAWKPLNQDEQDEKATAGMVCKADEEAMIDDDSGEAKEDDENSETEDIDEITIGHSGDEDLLYKYKDDLGTHYNMPKVISPEKVVYQNRVYNSYKYGKYGWFSKLFEPLLQEAMELPNGKKVSEDPELWICDYAVMRTRGLAQPPRNAFSEIQASEPFAWLLMYVEAQGDYAETIGHPGMLLRKFRRE
jgi:hypothetical protein